MTKIDYRMYKEDQAERIELRHQKRFDRITRQLEDLLTEVREYEPEANYYLANDTLNLMIGPSHDDREHALHENVALSRTIPGIDGGDW